jgi:uncharacterized membrane protein
MTSTDALNHDVARVLKTGFRIAAAMMATGLLVALVRQEPLRTEVDPISKIPSRLIHLRSSAFVDLSIIGIMLTPLASLVAILRRMLSAGDRRFAAYTLGVLVILCASIAISLTR